MEKNIAESEYSAQHYSFTPEMFFKDFSELLLEEMATIVQQSIQTLSSPNGKCNSQYEELIKTALQMHNSFGQHAKVVLNKLEPIIKEYFTIPPNVLLPIHSQFKTQYTNDDIKKLELEVEELEQTYKNKLMAIKMCHSEKSMLEALELVHKKIDEAVQVFRNIETTFNEVKELDKVIDEYHKSIKEFMSLYGGNTEDDLILFTNKFKTL